MTDAKLGLEVEYPISTGERFCHRGAKSRDLHREMDSEGWRPSDGSLHWDGTVGAEIVSDPLAPPEADTWYRAVIEEVEGDWNRDYEPTGLLTDHGSSAGMHIHLSPIERSAAETLAQWSSESWLQVFVCSSVVGGSEPHYGVFRDNYCQLSTSVRGSRYNVVNSRAGEGHYEWRLPEPMTEEHFSHVAEFLKLFIEDSPASAKEYVFDLFEREETVLTSVQRADAVGLDQVGSTELTRDPHPQSEDYFTTIQDDSDAPRIYHVRHPDGRYYAFESSQNTVFQDPRGRMCDRDTVVEADTLQRVYGSTAELIRDVVSNDGYHPTESAATDLLKEVSKKKRGQDADLSIDA
jgi:hypothetical protein